MLRTVEAVAATGVPTLVMTYWNPIERYGVERFAHDLAAAGGVGRHHTRPHPDEAGPWTAATDAAGLDRIFLVALSLDRRSGSRQSPPPAAASSTRPR